MLTCRICGCYCDPSDLIGMVCDDCRNKERKEMERREAINRFVKAEYRQLELEDFVNENSN